MKTIPFLATVLATLCIVNAQAPTTPSPPAAVPSTTVTFNGQTLTFPPMDKLPDVKDPQVVEWVKSLDLSKVPKLPASNGGVPNPFSANCNPPTVIEPDQGSWTCQKFTADDDIQECPKTGTWGLTYDDGPSASTPKLLSKLSDLKLKATLFVIGSRVSQNPQILKDAYDAGHNIGVHTWSHPALTSLSDEAIIAELLWTKKIIKDIIGVTPLYMRPPYGDTDNRVRAITRACGLKTVLWVPEFDSNDWALAATPPKPISTVIDTFETWMQKFPTMSTGFIVLEHDLFPQTVDAALIVLDRAVKVPNLTIMTVPQCVGDNAPYLELAGNGSTINKSSSNKTKSSPVKVANDSSDSNN
ncbi:9171_t:CDS:2 [Funneliformis caledonium]|uniref:chitin deacetylase n=1 Tax=Funneliformis caledonium TaxID=1117310 RepID=A0A9N8YRA4_9GLOM|nr:9171_t:CDS:2 [Funneliformis caledonium]